MSDTPIPPGALDRLAREVGKERTRTDSQGSAAFGWGTGAPAAIGRFRIMGPLGRGGMGVVYQAFDPDMNREVALKSLAAGPGDRLKREGEAIGRLEHPGIVRIYETGEELGRPFLVMELVKGRHLDEAWAGWNLKERVAALKAVARAVAHAHARGVAHRDLKPPNVLVGDDGAPRVTDFGLAAVEDARTKLTDPGSVMGTPAWMAPEQVLGLPAGPEADVHALGALLYLALTGSGPFEGPNPPAIYRKIVDEEAPWPRKRNVEAPASLEAVCLHAMEKDPAARPTAASFADELHLWLAGQPVRSRLPSPAVRLWRRARRNPLAWIGMIAAVAAIAVGASALTIQATRNSRQQRARDLARDAQPLASQALLALAAGDDDGAARLMAEFEKKTSAARALDPAASGGWFERAEYLRLTGDEDGAKRVLTEAKSRVNDPLLELEWGLLIVASYRRELRRSEQEAEAAARAGASRRLSPGKLQAGTTANIASLMLDGAVSNLGGLANPPVRVARAELALLKDDLDAASRQVEGLELPEAKVIAGTILERRGDVIGAIEAYTRAISTRQRHWPAWEARAVAREKLAGSLWKPGAEPGETEQTDAIADWAHLAEALPRRADYRIALATAAWKLGMMRVYRQAEAEATCRRAVKEAEAALAIEPQNAEARFAAGRAWSVIAGGSPAAQEAWNSAVDNLEAAAKALPNALDVQLELASALRMRGFSKRTRGESFRADYERALRVNDDILALAPDWLAARANQGLMLGEMGRWKEAVAAFEKAGTWATGDEATRAAFEEAKRRAGE